MNRPFRGDESKPLSYLQLIFREVARCSETSPAELARLLGLQRSTVNAKLRTLIQKGVVESHDGRNRLRLNPAFGYVAGIDLGGSHVHYAIADFRGETLCESDEKIRPEDGSTKLIRQTQEGVRILVARLSRHGRLRAGFPARQTRQTQEGVSGKSSFAINNIARPISKMNGRRPGGLGDVNVTNSDFVRRWQTCPSAFPFRLRLCP